jgi:hypothetical protein
MASGGSPATSFTPVSARWLSVNSRSAVTSAPTA